MWQYVTPHVCSNEINGLGALCVQPGKVIPHGLVAGSHQGLEALFPECDYFESPSISPASLLNRWSICQKNGKMQAPPRGIAIEAVRQWLAGYRGEGRTLRKDILHPFLDGFG